jgi:tetratricopeptide (TPR) repeat protein
MKHLALLLLLPGLGAAQVRAPSIDQLRSQCVSGDVVACRQAMRLQSDDAELASVAGDVFVQARRPAESILAYRRAQRLGFPDEESLKARVAGAESQRQTLLTVCNAQLDETARRACDAALLSGAADEFRVLRRRGAVLEALHKDSEALNDYLSAQRFNPQERDLAETILRQAQVTGRNDVAVLVGRGTALLALGRAADAVAPLRQALELEPGSRALQSLLQGAQSAPASAGTARNAAPSAETLESSQFPPHAEHRFTNVAPASFSH